MRLATFIVALVFAAVGAFVLRQRQQTSETPEGIQRRHDGQLVRSRPDHRGEAGLRGCGGRDDDAAPVVGCCGWSASLGEYENGRTHLRGEGAAPISPERVLSAAGAQAQSSRRRGRQGIHIVVKCGTW